MAPRTVVLFGGSSNERFVSTASAQNILRNLPTATPWFLTKNGEVIECAQKEVLLHSNPFEKEFCPQKPLFHFSTIENAIKNQAAQEIIVVLALHGQGGEDGTIQISLEKLGVAFTGSNSESSRLAFNMIAAKNIATQQGIRVAQHYEITPEHHELTSDILSSWINKYGQIVLKPVADGSSVGLYILDKSSNLSSIISELSNETRHYFVEEFISGAELTVGVVGSAETSYPLPPSEVLLKKGANFDYSAKYLGTGAVEVTPANVSEQITQAAQNVALKMHKALGCEGYSRSDMIITNDGPVFLETNTLPGLTMASFFPQQLVANGSTLEKFLLDEIERALKVSKTK